PDRSRALRGARPRARSSPADAGEGSEAALARRAQLRPRRLALRDVQRAPGRALSQRRITRGAQAVPDLSLRAGRHGHARRVTHRWAGRGGAGPPAVPGRTVAPVVPGRTPGRGSLTSPPARTSRSRRVTRSVTR